MTVHELIEELHQLESDGYSEREVHLSSDAEGNNINKLVDVGIDVLDDDVEAVVILWP